MLWLGCSCRPLSAPYTAVSSATGTLHPPDQGQSCLGSLTLPNFVWWVRLTFPSTASVRVTCSLSYVYWDLFAVSRGLGKEGKGRSGPFQSILKLENLENCLILSACCQVQNLRLTSEGLNWDKFFCLKWLKLNETWLRSS